MLWHDDLPGESSLEQLQNQPGQLRVVRNWGSRGLQWNSGFPFFFDDAGVRTFFFRLTWSSWLGQALCREFSSEDLVLEAVMKPQLLTGLQPLWLSRRRVQDCYQHPHHNHLQERKVRGYAEGGRSSSLTSLRNHIWAKYCTSYKLRMCGPQCSVNLIM